VFRKLFVRKREDVTGRFLLVVFLNQVASCQNNLKSLNTMCSVSQCSPVFLLLLAAMDGILVSCVQVAG
jgi:hypothetical protein